MDIIEKARELGLMIANSDEMTNFKKSEEGLYQDSKANTILNDLKLLQTELTKAFEETSDKDIIESIKERITAKYQEANNNEILKNYFEASSKFNNLVKTINDVISYSISGEEGCSPNKCGSCGGGCK